MSLALFPVTRPLPSPRRGGRPAVADSPAEREKHIQLATLRVAHGATVAQAAEAFDVSRRTVHYWTKLALSYDDPRCRFLRARLAR